MASTTYYEQSRPEVRPFIPATCRRILEIGCSAGRFMAALKAERPGLRAVGIEPFPDAARRAADVFDRLVEAPVEAALDELADARLGRKLAVLDQDLAPRSRTTSGVPVTSVPS